jgi:hypothetical protein
MQLVDIAMSFPRASGIAAASEILLDLKPGAVHGIPAGFYRDVHQFSRNPVHR